jgi:hypothetical protein
MYTYIHPHSDAKLSRNFSILSLKSWLELCATVNEEQCERKIEW